jgi:hypothetical protein
MSSQWLLIAASTGAWAGPEGGGGGGGEGGGTNPKKNAVLAQGDFGSRPPED